MSRRRQHLGKTGEELAVQHLLNLGYTIVERNVRFRQGEIDIVARDGRHVVFVEVRTRRSHEWGSALESVGPQKQRKLLQLARLYLATRHLDDAPARIDVIGITWTGDGPARIEHVPNALIDA